MVRTGIHPFRVCGVLATMQEVGVPLPISWPFWITYGLSLEGFLLTAKGFCQEHLFCGTGQAAIRRRMGTSSPCINRIARTTPQRSTARIARCDPGGRCVLAKEAGDVSTRSTTTERFFLAQRRSVAAQQQAAQRTAASERFPPWSSARSLLPTLIRST
jgi:hypothetical protein